MTDYLSELKQYGEFYERVSIMPVKDRIRLAASIMNRLAETIEQLLERRNQLSADEQNQLDFLIETARSLAKELKI